MILMSDDVQHDTISYEAGALPIGILKGNLMRK